MPESNLKRYLSCFFFFFFPESCFLNKSFTILYIKVEKVPLGEWRRKLMLLVAGLQIFGYMACWRERKGGYFLENYVLMTETYLCFSFEFG